jgi:hypothetical protein
VPSVVDRSRRKIAAAAAAAAMIQPPDDVFTDSALHRKRDSLTRH